MYHKNFVLLRMVRIDISRIKIIVNETQLFSPFKSLEKDLEVYYSLV